jgi:hypothetical protein
MEEVAYRFVPCDEDGRPRERSQHTTITTQAFTVGSRIEATLLGYTTWEVVEVRREAGSLLGARDKFGNDVTLAGTIVCRGVS